MLWIKAQTVGSKVNWAQLGTVNLHCLETEDALRCTCSAASSRCQHYQLQFLPGVRQVGLSVKFCKNDTFEPEPYWPEVWTFVHIVWCTSTWCMVSISVTRYKFDYYSWFRLRPTSIFHWHLLIRIIIVVNYEIVLHNEYMTCYTYIIREITKKFLFQKMLLSLGIIESIETVTIIDMTWLLSHAVLETCLSMLKWHAQSAHRINGFLGCFCVFQPFLGFGYSAWRRKRCSFD